MGTQNLWIGLFMVLMGFLLILILLYSKHIILYDEKHIKHANEKIRQETWKGLGETYKMLKINLSLRDFQEGGDFFYSQRLSQIFHQFSQRRADTIIYLLHYVVNGFGERYIRPLIWFILTIVFFSGIYEKKDFIATEQTPYFLITQHSNVKQNIYSYKKQTYKRSTNANGTVTRQYFSEILNDSFITRLAYSASQFISPFTAKNRGWFKTISPTAVLNNIVETILLYLFFGAFVLAIKNRIKR